MSTEISHKTLRLDECDLEAPEEMCPVCASPRRGPVEAILQREPEVLYLACAHCGASSVSRMPTDGYLDAFYSRYYSDHDKEVTFSGEQRFARHILHHLPFDRLPRAIRILDYGGGDGSLAQACARQLKRDRPDCSIEIWVVDYACASNVADAFEMHYCRDLAALEGRKFNIVIASAVLEHIKRPREVIAGLFRVLDKPGYFYARTPYSLPMRKLFPGFELSYPMHLHDMGSVYWDNFLRTYRLDDCTLLKSQPSIVSTQFASAPLVTTVAHALKWPARVERRLLGRQGKRLFWPFVGGWEAIIGRT